MTVKKLLATGQWTLTTAWTHQGFRYTLVRLVPLNTGSWAYLNKLTTRGWNVNTNVVNGYYPTLTEAWAAYIAALLGGEMQE